MFRYKTEPYEHQRTALEISYDNKNFGYFMEMGCGKSKVLIDNITWLYDNGLINTAVIVAPKGVYRNWQVSEIPTHLPDDIQPEVYVWSANPNKAQRERLSEGAESREGLRILLVNVEGLGASKKVSQYVSTRRLSFGR